MAVLQLQFISVDLDLSQSFIDCIEVLFKDAVTPTTSLLDVFGVLTVAVELVQAVSKVVILVC